MVLKGSSEALCPPPSLELRPSCNKSQSSPPLDSSSQPHNGVFPEDKEPVKYGELIILGHNGSLANGDKGRRRSRLALFKRPKANGVKPDVIHNVSTPLVSKHAISSSRLIDQLTSAKDLLETSAGSCICSRGLEHGPFGFHFPDLLWSSEISWTAPSTIYSPLPVYPYCLFGFTNSVWQSPSPPGGDQLTALLLSVQDALSNKSQHSISYTLSRSHSVIVDYTHDINTDMFQIGRSTESMIDFVVTDTAGSINGHGGGAAVEGGGGGGQSAQSTISRYACRIMCERSAPYTARIYAAGFDSSKNIFLGERAAKWRTSDGLMDGLTTNGVLVMHPAGEFVSEAAPGVWREISVCGNIFALRETRSAQQRGKLVENESNTLQDGSLIDLCGATLLWRTSAGLRHIPTLKQLESLRQELNAARPQCPVGFNTLAFPSLAQREIVDKKQPWVYVNCGHVHGYHNWGYRKEKGHSSSGGTAPVGTGERECPMCRRVGPYVPLWLGCEGGLYLDAGPPTHAFCPCGHVCSEKTVVGWSQIPLPHGTHAFHAACPFCGTWLTGEQGHVKLIFQGPVD
ncbi:E3 ubiquitin-protein ligase pellino homolog 3 isoform X2 [Kryptolebias marmoratus]|nr:E3 ubiquitin-protein ligase pellino homolog 3 isoform X2 [Kryptolebias marmoratus]XP_024864046.1 E3 ubiquitin-protein ligase pellino homolog 3 isoform X2 [Kryptolebias marmoratus]XP_024864047.1 E3 ubiquitin-protein ligase pellino homolog 3 isoform X2 [Kryptolebias marmoratus]XP_037832670.1 E3 ubiquitin-protein ligase pellino homolog 3 isoform X2 [Kryptolebias marmoratus]